MRFTCTITMALALLCAFPGLAHAGPWTPEPGHGYGKLWLKWLPGFGYHSGAGETLDYGAYHELFFAGYAEVGVVDSLAVTAHSDLFRLFVLEDPRTGDSEAHIAPGDPALGLRWRFLRVERFVAAVEGSIRAPLATGDPVQTVYGAEAPHVEIGALTIGQGAWDFATTLSVGYAWDHFYLAGGGGAIFRTDGYDHAITWTAEGGGTIADRVGLRLRVTGHHPVDTGSAPRAESPSGIGNGTSYVGVAIEGDYEIVEHWYLGLTLEGGLFAIRRQTGGPVIAIYGATKF